MNYEVDHYSFVSDFDRRVHVQIMLTKFFVLFIPRVRMPFSMKKEEIL